MAVLVVRIMESADVDSRQAPPVLKQAAGCCVRSGRAMVLLTKCGHLSTGAAWVMRATACPVVVLVARIVESADADSRQAPSALKQTALQEAACALTDVSFLPRVPCTA